MVTVEGLPAKFRYHDLRHFYASLLISEGADIKTVEFGWPIGMPTCRPMGQGLFEVRSNLPNRIARVLFCIEAGRMVLLHGFIKKERKTPKVDIDIAKQRLKKLRGST